MRRLRVVLSGFALACIAGCGAAKSENQSAGEQQPKPNSSAPEPLKEWEEFRFGMSFDEAITAASGIRWDAQSFQTCRNEIPVKGCSLSADPDRSYRPAFAGMELMPSLEFNEDAQLTDLSLRRIYRSGVAPEQCEAIHARLLDRLTAMFGRARVDDDKESVALIRRSPRGNLYQRSKETTPVMVAGIERFRTATDGSDISLLTTFTAGSEYVEPACYTGFYVDGPKALRRRPREKLDLPADEEAATDLSEESGEDEEMSGSDEAGSATNTLESAPATDSENNPDE